MKHACRARRGSGKCGSIVELRVVQQGRGGGGKEEDVAENGSLFFFFFFSRIDRFDGLEKWIEGALHRKLAVDERRNRRIEIGCDIYIHV